ncbi:MAG TPA: nuclear transport factor 2 family protein, partial [Aeromicrobium sp.]|nr:nuclear transport factor 2 family protein [Aeromicrobium sp.]
MHEVTELERTLWDPQSRNDPELVDRLLHPDYLEVGSTGRTWTRRDILKPVGHFTAELTELAEAELLPGAVLVTYTSVVHELSGIDEVTGGRVKRSSLW